MIIPTGLTMSIGVTQFDTMNQMKVALVHDDLVQWGGAERMLVGLMEAFPQADLFTSVYDRDNLLLQQYFGRKKIQTSFIQQIPGWKSLYKQLLPLYPIAFEQFDFSSYDLVISQTTRFAKSILTKPGTKHICYCHTPPRFLHDFNKGDKGYEGRYFDWLRRFDKVSATRPDLWIAGSKNAQRRIKDIYELNSELIYPFVDIANYQGIEGFEGGYLLVITRLNSYKRVDLAVRLSKKMKIQLKVVGVGPEMEKLRDLAGPQVEFLGSVDEGLIKKLIAGCRAVVICGEEDFGLAPLEAQALGKPVIAYAQGGVTESVLDGVTGYFFDQQTVSSLEQALRRLQRYGYNKESCRKQAEKFSKDKFIQAFRRLAQL